MNTYYIKDKKAPDAYEDDAIEEMIRAINMYFDENIFNECFKKHGMKEIQKHIDYYAKNGYDESEAKAKKKLDRLNQLYRETVRFSMRLEDELSKLTYLYK